MTYCWSKVLWIVCGRASGGVRLCWRWVGPLRGGINDWGRASGGVRLCCRQGRVGPLRGGVNNSHPLFELLVLNLHILDK